jgi:ADP-heptose:LPS heptosyltransferase
MKLVKVIRKIIIYFVYQIDGLIGRICRGTTKKNTVALVRVDFIGDFILWLPAAEKLRSIYPQSKIILIANSSWSELAIDLPYWDEVIAINVKWFSFGKLLYRWRMIGYFASRGFQKAIQPTFSRSLSNGDSIVRATNAPVRIGSVGDFSNLSQQDANIANGWYTKLYPSEIGELQEIDRNLKIMSQISGVNYEITLPRLELKGVVRGDLTKSLDKYVAVAPGASWQGRCWSISNFIELIQFIFDRFDLEVVICGSYAEFDLCDSIKKQVPRAINLAGKTTLKEMAKILKGAILVIGNESSAIHLANAVDTQSFCILGGGHFGRFLPYPVEAIGIKPIPLFKKMDCYQCNWRCTLSKTFSNGAPCIQGVSVNDVKVNVEQLLKNNLPC